MSPPPAGRALPRDLEQELLWGLRTRLLVETGTAHGGSALYLAAVCETIGGGEVVSLDSREKFLLGFNPGGWLRRLG
jgi:cephalosporin hydroxylase